jgi:hypothetical protein
VHNRALFWLLDCYIRFYWLVDAEIIFFIARRYRYFTGIVDWLISDIFLVRSTLSCSVASEEGEEFNTRDWGWFR